MISLVPIDENNFLKAVALRVTAQQQNYVADSAVILARAYAYRNQRAICWGIYSDQELIGLALIHDLVEEPSCYHLCAFMIDRSQQGRGHGRKALGLILDHCRREKKFSRIEVCVKKVNSAAIHVYEKLGFRNTGFTDPDAPDSLCMACSLDDEEHAFSYLEIKYRDIVLRDMVESDIADDIRWNTVETEWALWDAPWEMEVELPKFDPDAYRREQLAILEKPKNGFRWSLEMDTAGGVHIGAVNAYLIDENWDWISVKDVQPAQRVYRTLGIEINDSRFWNRGLGTQALAAFVQYHLDHGFVDLCLQTWSGNIRMIRVAEKLGFVECNRIAGNRHIRGESYDSLTFRLDLDRFHKFLSENP